MRQGYRGGKYTSSALYPTILRTIVLPSRQRSHRLFIERIQRKHFISEQNRRSFWGYAGNLHLQELLLNASIIGYGRASHEGTSYHVVDCRISDAGKTDVPPPFNQATLLPFTVKVDAITIGYRLSCILSLS